MYGSANGGRTLYNRDDKLKYLMRTVAHRLNLHERAVVQGDTVKMIAGPSDIEAHKGLDGRYYVIDYARTMPPEAPSWDTNKLKKEKRLEKLSQIFYKLLRPTLVLKCEEPLCSDTFSGFIVDAKYDQEMYRQAVEKATQYLKDEVVKSSAWSLSDRPEVPDLDTIVNTIRHDGINLRHLGLVRRAILGVNAHQLKKMILTGT